MRVPGDSSGLWHNDFFSGTSELEHLPLLAEVLPIRRYEE